VTKYNKNKRFLETEISTVCALSFPPRTHFYLGCISSCKWHITSNRLLVLNLLLWCVWRKKKDYLRSVALSDVTALYMSEDLNGRNCRFWVSSPSNMYPEHESGECVVVSRTMKWPRKQQTLSDVFGHTTTSRSSTAWGMRWQYGTHISVTVSGSIWFMSPKVKWMCSARFLGFLRPPDLGVSGLYVCRDKVICKVESAFLNS
jgi:hypothetical protein